MELTVGDDFLQVIGQQLSSHVDSHNGLLHSFSVHKWHDVGEAETTVNHKATRLIRELDFVLITAEICRSCPQHTLKTVLIEQNFIQPFLNRSKVEVGLCNYEFFGVWLKVEAALAKSVVPDGLLVIPIYQVALLKWKHVE